MSVSRRQLRVAFILGVVVFVVVGQLIGPKLAQILTGLVSYSGTIPLQTNNGVTVHVTGER